MPDKKPETPTTTLTADTRDSMLLPKAEIEWEWQEKWGEAKKKKTKKRATVTLR